MSQQPATLRDFIAFDLRASGPRTFEQLRVWIHQQYSESTPDWEIAQTLNTLIRDGRVYLTERGDAFDHRRVI